MVLVAVWAGRQAGAGSQCSRAASLLTQRGPAGPARQTRGATGSRDKGRGARAHLQVRERLGEVVGGDGLALGLGKVDKEGGKRLRAEVRHRCGVVDEDLGAKVAGDDGRRQAGAGALGGGRGEGVRVQAAWVREGCVRAGPARVRRARERARRYARWLPAASTHAQSATPQATHSYPRASEAQTHRPSRRWRRHRR